LIYQLESELVHRGSRQHDPGWIANTAPGESTLKREDMGGSTPEIKFRWPVVKASPCCHQYG
jgi:hypothetical protein